MRRVMSLLRPRLQTALLLCSLVCIASSYELHAQGGSNFSTIGLGDVRSSYGATYQSLGDVSISTPSDYAINLSNPALWTDVKSTRLQSGYRFNQILVNQNGSSVGNNNGKLDGALVMFAIDTANGINACIGLAPSSSVNYAFTKHSAIPLPDNGGIVNATSLYAGSGGMNTGYLGAAWRISDGISIGAMAMFQFGLIRDSITTNIATDNAYTALTTQEDDLSAVGFKFGIQTHPADNLTVGACFGIGGNLLSKSILHYYTLTSSSLVSFDSVQNFEHSTTLPMLFGAGASYRSGKFLFVADAELQNVSNTDYRITDLGRWTNASRFGIGMSRLGMRSAGTAYWDRVNFNAGFGHQALLYTFSNSQVSENYLSVGAQLPFGNASMIDVAFTFGSRGTSNSNDINEKFFRFGFTISVGEAWFIPFKREFQ